MIDLESIYSKKRGPATEATAAGPAAASETTATAEKASPAPPSPPLQTPPGLPQEYIDANLMDQPIPLVSDSEIVVKARVLSDRLISDEAIINAESIPYSPASESRLVRERVAQGPRVFVSRAQRDKFERGQDEEKTRPRSKAPTDPHPDTLRPGTFVPTRVASFRPGE